MIASSSTALLRSSSIGWAVGGWAFFIAENVVLSENRSFLIHHLGDAGYHNIYGLISTTAVGSIAYAYLKKVQNTPPFLWMGTSVPVPSRIASFLLLSLGLGIASQALPKFQIPVAFVKSKDDEHQDTGSTTKPNALPTSMVEKTTMPSFQVRCPFDFTDLKRQNGDDNPHGMERISRHPGLWSMALVGVGHAFLVPSVPQRIWLAMPVMVAWVGGSHTDSRFRRGMGGTLHPEYDAMTSNVPFAALITRQMQGVGDWDNLVAEMKPLNAVLATAVAAVWVLRRSTGPVPAVVRQAMTTATK